MTEISFSENIKRLRKQAGLTQQQLAERTQCTRQDISKLENGRFRGGFHKIERICALLQCTFTLQVNSEEQSEDPDESGTIRILAIDDDPAVLWGYEQTFSPDQATGINTLAALLQIGERVEGDDGEEKQSRYAITTTQDGKSGVELIEQALEQGIPYHLLLLDMRMPGRWDGLRTAREIRKVDPDIKIILVSAYRDYTLTKMREIIGDDFVFQSKPYNQEDLIQLSSYITRQ